MIFFYRADFSKAPTMQIDGVTTYLVGNNAPKAAL